MMVVPEFVDLLTCCTVGLDHVTKHKKIFGWKIRPQLNVGKYFYFIRLKRDILPWATAEDSNCTHLKIKVTFCKLFSENNFLIFFVVF